MACPISVWLTPLRLAPQQPHHYLWQISTVTWDLGRPCMHNYVLCIERPAIMTLCFIFLCSKCHHQQMTTHKNLCTFFPTCFHSQRSCWSVSQILWWLKQANGWTVRITKPIDNSDMTASNPESNQDTDRLSFWSKLATDSSFMDASHLAMQFEHDQTCIVNS